MSTLYSGIAASDGIAIAKAYRIDEPILVVEKRRVKNCSQEINRFNEMLLQTKMELLILREKAERDIGSENAAIFDAHLLVLEDSDFLTTIVNKIQTDKVNAEYAVQETVNLFVNMFEQSENGLLRERVIDIYDIQQRLIAHLLGVHLPDTSLITENVIVISKDLTPSETLQLNSCCVKGIITERGASSSHSAIIARSLNIPAIVGMKEGFDEITHGDTIIVDGFRGQIHINPTPEIVRIYKTEFEERKTEQQKWSFFVDKPTITKDGHQVVLAANIVSSKEIKHVFENGAEGVGLFRTEFLFMGRESAPTEDEQFEIYKKVLIDMQERPVVIRTLDIGGDKVIPYIHFPYESNPFLGNKSIRYSLTERVHFETQLKAILRASMYGNVKIMFPMIATLEELHLAKEILHKVKRELVKSGIPFKEDIEVGIMVEVPVTAIMADIFAKEVDFFSIGTNDLIQYTMAADRMNEQVAYLYQPHNPAIFRLIKMVIDAAHKEKKWVSLCGEMAGDEIALPVLMGLGADELSMKSTSILKVRSNIYQYKQAEVFELSQKVLDLNTAEDVKDYVKTFINQSRY